MVPWALLLLLLGGTALGSRAILQSEDDALRARFETDVEEKQGRISARMETYIALLRGGAALFAAAEADEGEVSREQFSRFVRRVNVERLYPGLLGIGVARLVSSGRIAELEMQQQRTGWSDFRVWPSSANDPRVVVLYLEPQNRRNRAAIGYDMASEPVRADAIRHAGDSGFPVVSSPVTLVQEIDEEKQPGFLIYVPVYWGGDVPTSVEERRARLRGFVYAACRAGDMFRATLIPDGEVSNYQVYDGLGVAADALLYDARGTSGAAPKDALSLVRPLALGDHAWTIRFIDGGGKYDSVRALRWFLPVGLAVSFTVFLLARLQLRSAQALREQKMRAEEETALRERLLAIVGHDLRNPLGAISMAAHMLARKDELDARDRVTARRIVDSAGRMARIISQLLDYARLRRGGGLSPHLVECDIHEIARHVVEELRLVHPSATITLAAEGSCALSCDADLLGQVLSNLVGNALEHGAGAATVHLRGNQNGVAIDIHNPGPPIPPDVLPRIFEPFERGGASTSLGLGLYISREIVLAHGGDIQVRSPDGDGTTFSVWMPAPPLVGRENVEQCTVRPPGPASR